MKAIVCGPNPESIPVVRLSVWFTDRVFLPPTEIAASTAHRPVPKPFPEGELFDSPGFAAQRLPWVRDIQ